MSPATKRSAKVECINLNTGGRMKIDAATYELFSKAIYHALMGSKGLTFTELVEGVKDCFQQQKISFDGSVGWYTVTVKNDMQSKGILDVFNQKGAKLHRLSK